MDWCMWLYRELYWCKRRFCPAKENHKPISVHTDNLPWFWIGTQCRDGSVVTVTETINRRLEYGVRVTPDYLSDVTGFSDGIWKYMDSKTLEELDFPSEGFIIEDVLDKPISDSE